MYVFLKRWELGNFIGLKLSSGSPLSKQSQLAQLITYRDGVYSISPQLAEIVEAVRDFVGCFILDANVYEWIQNDQGYVLLRDTISHIKHIVPNVPIVVQDHRFHQTGFGVYGADLTLLNEYSSLRLDDILSKLGQDEGVGVPCLTYNSVFNQKQCEIITLTLSQLQGVFSPGFVSQLSAELLAKLGWQKLSGDSFCLPAYHLTLLQLEKMYESGNQLFLYTVAGSVSEVESLKILAPTVPVFLSLVGQVASDEFIRSAVNAMLPDRSGFILNDAGGFVDEWNKSGDLEATKRRLTVFRSFINEPQL